MSDSAAVNSYADPTEYASLYTYLDGNSKEYCVGGIVFATAIGADGNADTLTHVSPTAGLPVHQQTGATWTVTGAVTNAGTFAVQESGALLTAAQLIDDVVYVDKASWTASTSKHSLSGAVYEAATPTYTNGTTNPLRTTVSGALIVFASGTSSIQGSQSMPADGGLGYANALLATISHQMVYNGTTWDRLRGTAADGMLVNLGSNNDVTVSGTVTANLSGTDNAVLDVIAASVHAEDATHSTGESGVMTLAVRNDALASLVDTDGDYAPLQVDAMGALYVSEICRVDSGNSSTTPLSGGATFTGTGVDVMGFRNVNVSVFADQASATDGLKIQFSSDNTNWDFEEDFTVSASIGETHTVPVMAQYLRVTYTNGGSAQGAFRLQTILVPDDLTGTVANLDTVVDGSNQAVLTRSVLSAYNGTAYTNINATTNGNLKISVQEVSDGLDVGAGNAGTETLRVSVATDDVNLSTIAGAVSGTEMQVDVVAPLPAGTNAIGKLSANSGVDIGDVDVTSIAAGSNLIGDVGLQPRTSGGLTMHKTISAASTNATSVKGSAGQVYAVEAFNTNASARYLKFYNKASAPTVGTDTPVKVLTIPGNTAGAGLVLSWPQGLAFGTGIAFALTTGVTDADTGAVAANELVVNLDYN